MTNALIQNDMLSHGTIECTDLAKTRRFLTEFLGLGIHRPFPEAQYLYLGGLWSVVCVCVEGGAGKQQTTDNHFKISVATPDEVDQAHKAAVTNRDTYGIRSIEEIAMVNGQRGFLLQDLNSTWWEITTASQSYYDRLFEAGDGI